MPDTASIAPVTVGPVTIGGERPVMISGPCAIESADHARFMADEIATRMSRAQIPYIFKASYDKANRTSIHSFRGPGIDEGLRILEQIRNDTGLPVTTDVHDVEQIKAAGQVVDLIQIPAFLCRQTDLIVAAAETGTATSIKKGQFLAPWDCQHIVNKFKEAGGERLVLIERGSSFGYNTLVSDFRSLPILRSMGVPVIYDATHSVQSPGGKGASSGGDGAFAPAMIRAALAVGCEGIFAECHDNPSAAKSDGANVIPLPQLEGVLAQVNALHDAIGRPLPITPG